MVDVPPSQQQITLGEIVLGYLKYADGYYVKTLQLFDGEQLIKGKSTADNVDNSKRDPDIIHFALYRVRHSAGDVILLGDTPYDVEASLKAIIRVFTLRCGELGDVELHKALAVYDDPLDLLHHFDESPFAVSKANQLFRIPRR